MHWMREMHERLAWAREKAGYENATHGAAAVGEVISTYLGHENGSRGFGRKKAEKYARRFNVSLEWLLTNKGEPTAKQTPPPKSGKVPMVGYVAAGAEAHFTPAGELGEVVAPDVATESTVAVEIRGDSLGPLFDRWIVYYDEVRRPVTSDLVGRLCVVGLADGRILIKKIKRSKTKGLYHLLSQGEDPLLDEQIEWAAQVKSMVPG